MIRKENQLSLFGRAPQKIVNVASVSHLSPFRYPGGKTWLVPRIRQWLSNLKIRPSEFVEVFAGGAIAGLTVASEHLADHVKLVELDENVAAVWETIIYGDAEWLADRIIRFDMTKDAAEKILSADYDILKDKAFQTIVRNRVSHGGIMAHGAGLMKHGENGKGMKSRWYPETLKKRILNIVRFRDMITFVRDDGLGILEENSHCENKVFFIDPPYTAAGKKAGRRLYKHFQLDHEKLFRMAADIKGDFLMTYENSEGVHRLADRHGFDREAVPMKNTHHAKMTELLIGRDLEWGRA